MLIKNKLVGWMWSVSSLKAEESFENEKYMRCKEISLLNDWAIPDNKTYDRNSPKLQRDNVLYFIEREKNSLERGLKV